jgi:hypothetical protein
MQKNDYRRAFIQKTNCVIGVYQFLFKTLLSHISFSKIYISLTNMKFFSHLFHRELPDENLKKARANYKKEVGVLIVFGRDETRYFIRRNSNCIWRSRFATFICSAPILLGSWRHDHALPKDL